MHDPIFVAVGDALDDLVDKLSQPLRVNAHCVVFKHLQQVLFDVLKDQIQTTLSLECLLESDNVLVLQ